MVVAPGISNIGRLNESPHPKVGKCAIVVAALVFFFGRLNESPHPKVGKFR